MDCMGELGNYLHYIAHGYGLFELAKREYGIHTKLIFRPKENSKVNRAKAATSYLRECFPRFRNFQTNVLHNLGNQWEAQEDWLGEGVAAWLRIRKAEHTEPESLDESFRFLQQALLQKMTTDPASNSSETKNAQGWVVLSKPFLLVQRMHNYHFLDEHYDAYRRLFEFDETKCCKNLPHPDEEVFVSPVVTMTVFGVFNPIIALYMPFSFIAVFL
jgi:hypothetical protein